MYKAYIKQHSCHYLNASVLTNIFLVATATQCVLCACVGLTYSNMRQQLFVQHMHYSQFQKAGGWLYSPVCRISSVIVIVIVVGVVEMNSLHLKTIKRNVFKQ